VRARHETAAESGSVPAGFADVYERYFADIYRYIAGRLGRNVADDIAADTFVIALRRHADFDPGRGPVRAWLYGIATNLVAQHRRAERRRYQALARAGAQELTAGHDSGALPACRDGFWVLKAVGQPAEESRTRCDPAAAAAYQPAMPTAPAALGSYLHKQFGLDPGDSGGLVTQTETMITTGYQTPAQMAAIYRLLAQTSGLTVVAHVTNVRGQTGVGIRSGTWKGSVYTIIFDRRTFAPLGMNWTGVSGPMKGTHNGEVVLKTAIVDSTPPLP
jgi:DNA-directed RNA polymerase specialized sigma24 family protein